MRVTPRSSRNRIEIGGDDAIKVWVTAPPTDGQANKAVCGLIAEKLNVAKSTVTLHRGEASRQKQIAIQGMTTVDALNALRSRT